MFISLIAAAAAAANTIAVEAARRRDEHDRHGSRKKKHTLGAYQLGLFSPGTFSFLLRPRVRSQSSRTQISNARDAYQRSVDELRAAHKSTEDFLSRWKESLSGRRILSPNRTHTKVPSREKYPWWVRG